MHHKLFPSNTTSVLQPMDQGTIHSLKSFCRKQLVMHILQKYEDNNMEYNISLLQAIFLLEKTRRQVRSTNICNCFRCAGHSKDVLLARKDANVKDKENLSISLRLEKHKVKIVSRDVIEHYESCDDELYTSDTPTEVYVVSEGKRITDAEEDLDDH